MRALIWGMWRWNTAEEEGIAFYETMVSVRQAMLNLLAAGLFHLVEQQLAHSCRDGAFTIEPPHKTNLFEVSPWYREHFFLDLENLHNWGRVDELRLVTNTVKHAEINQIDRLRKLRPDLFRNPSYAEVPRIWQRAKSNFRHTLVFNPSPEQIFS